MESWDYNYCVIVVTDGAALYRIAVKVPVDNLQVDHNAITYWHNAQSKARLRLLLPERYADMRIVEAYPIDDVVAIE